MSERYRAAYKQFIIINYVYISEYNGVLYMMGSRLAKILAFASLMSAARLGAGVHTEDYGLFSNLHQLPAKVIEYDAAKEDPTDPWVYGPAYKEHRAELRKKKEEAQERCQTKLPESPLLDQIAADSGMQPLHQPQPARLSHTEISEHFELEGYVNEGVSLKEVLKSAGDKDKLLAAIFPQSYRFGVECDSGRLKAYFIDDITQIKNNLIDLAQNPAIQKPLNYGYDKIPFDGLIDAIEHEDRDSANKHLSQIRDSLEDMQDMAHDLKDLDLAARIEQAFRIRSRTLAELQRLRPYFDQLIHDPMWKKGGFSRDVDVRAHSSAYSSMEFADGKDRAKIEQAKVLSARAKGCGHLRFRLDRSKFGRLRNNPKDILDEAIARRGHLAHCFDDIMTVDASAAYHLDYQLDEIDAFRFSFKEFGFGAGKKHFERGVNDLAVQLHLDLADFDFSNSKSESEETGDTALTHFFIDHKGKTNLFLDLGFESTESILEDEITHEFIKKRGSRALANLMASRNIGNYAPFFKVQDGEAGCGLYLNSRLLGGRTGIDGIHEIYAQIGKKDSTRLMEYIRQIDIARTSHFAGRDNQIESLRNRINEELGGLMFRYSQQLDKKEYSVLLGKGKLYLEAGQSIDGWLRSNFARMNLFGAHLSAEFGKKAEDGVDTQNYQLNLPLHTDDFGGFFLDVEHSVSEEDRPAVNYQIRRTIRF